MRHGSTIISTIMVFMCSLVVAWTLPSGEAQADVLQISATRSILSAGEAEFTGEIHWRGDPERVLGSWRRGEDRVSWWVETEAAGDYETSLIYACEKGSGGSVVEIACGSSRLTTRIHPTGSGSKLLTVPVGILGLPGGVSSISVRALSKPDAAPEVLRLRGLVLEDGFVSLFNGKDLEGWDTRYMRGEGYVVEQGRIVCKRRGGGNLYTDKEYTDFIYRFEFKLERCANNGLGIRARKDPEPPKALDGAYHGLEIQILDNECPRYKDKIQPWQYHGSIYGVFPGRRGFLRPTGEWNVEEVICRGHEITVKLNGVKIAGGDVSKAESHLKNHVGKNNEKGYISFLGHGTRVEFRNIRLKELEKLDTASGRK